MLITFNALFSHLANLNFKYLNRRPMIKINKIKCWFNTTYEPTSGSVNRHRCTTLNRDQRLKAATTIQLKIHKMPPNSMFHSWRFIILSEPKTLKQ